MLKRRHASGLPFLLDFSWKAISLSWLSIMFTVGWSCLTIILRYVPSTAVLGRMFMMDGCWAVWNAFPASVEMMIMWCSLFLCWCAGSHWFICVMLTHPSEPEMSPTWMWWVICVCMCVCLVTQLCPTLCNPMDCSLPGSSVPGDSPGKNIGVGCHAPLQGIFSTQGSNPGLLHCRWIL